MKRGVITFPGSTLYVEVPTTSQEQQYGLRGRTSLLDENGMLFLATAERQWTMTMEGVLIPLVMLGLDEQNKITRAVFANPGNRVPPIWAKSVLEVTPRWWIKKGSFEKQAGIWVEA